MKYLLAIIYLCLSLCSPQILAAANPTVSKTDTKNVNSALAKLSKIADHKFTLSDIVPSPIPGLLQVTAGSNVFYISSDGRYLLSGDFVDLTKDKNSWNLTELALRKVRTKILATVDPKDFIVFAATAPKIASVVVFTDIECHYCQKMQENIKSYTDLGIEVKYLAFPRHGLKSKAYAKAVSVWCSDNPQRDFTLAMQGKDVPEKECKHNPVARDFELGKQLMVTGTPTIFLENGVKIGGMLDAESLAKTIKEM